VVFAKLKDVDAAVLMRDVVEPKTTAATVA
jgi:hypothetical protein